GLSRGPEWTIWPTAVAAGLLTALVLGVAPVLAGDGLHGTGMIATELVLGPALCLAGAWLHYRGPQSAVAKAGAIVLPVLGVLAVVAVPLALDDDGGTHHLPGGHYVAARYDVRIVTDGTPHALPRTLPPRDLALAGLDAEYSVGYAGADGDVRWTLLHGSEQQALAVAAQGRRAPVQYAAPQRNAAQPPLARPAPQPDADADAVVAVVVDPTPPVIDGDVARLANVTTEHERVGYWRRVGHAARETGTPTFALIQSQAAPRLTAWSNFTIGGGGNVSVQKLGRRRITDAALALAVGAPSAAADETLALKFRPILLFDSKEAVPRPLSIDWLFRKKMVFVCEDRGRSSTCDENATTDPNKLRNGDTHLKLERPDASDLVQWAREDDPTHHPAAAALSAPASGTAAAVGAPPAATPEPLVATAAVNDAVPTTIYVHPVAVDQVGRHLLYLDYWWFLQDDTVDIGKSTFCGAGLIIPGKTCHDHDSDWEGMTVVVDRTRGQPHIVAVHYAEHDQVVGFEWRTLRNAWARIPRAQEAGTTAEKDDIIRRPVAFVAEGTHASYPGPCPDASAPGGAAHSPNCGQLGTPSRGESRHNGQLGWIGDGDGACGGPGEACVQLLPTRAGGRAGASWNAFDGTWGHQHCVLRYYCDTAGAPRTPSTQKRYKNPAHCTYRGAWDADKHRFTAEKGDCPL
ncbi:MAG TPA: hypothetical protein VFY45_13020, partial [Baekduia sp.]|nr:hypothetical protein [Baekduia sp.]